MPRRALLVTGGLASGKTAVVAEMVAIAEERGLPAAAIDLDWLGWATSTPLAPAQLIERNLALVARTYAEAGVERLALARGIVDGDGLRGIRTALSGWELSAVRLVVPTAVARRRLAARDAGVELATHLAELARFEVQVANAAAGVPVIDGGDRPLRDVALDAWRAGGWDD